MRARAASPHGASCHHDLQIVMRRCPSGVMSTPEQSRRAGAKGDTSHGGSRLGDDVHRSRRRPAVSIQQSQHPVPLRVVRKHAEVLCRGHRPRCSAPVTVTCHFTPPLCLRYRRECRGSSPLRGRTLAFPIRKFCPTCNRLATNHCGGVDHWPGEIHPHGLSTLVSRHGWARLANTSSGQARERNFPAVPRRGHVTHGNAPRFSRMTVGAGVPPGDGEARGSRSSPPDRAAARDPISGSGPGGGPRRGRVTRPRPARRAE